jgi:GAF domain-containing protein
MRSMRWQVEMTPIGKTEAQSVVVEAESWQKALQQARALRGETGPMSGFSIELLEQGYRAVDPMARLIYTVKKAGDDAPLDTSLGPAKAKSEAPAAIPAAPHTPAGGVAAAPRMQSAPPPGPKANLKQTLAFGSSGEAMEALMPKPAAVPAPAGTERMIPDALPSGSADATLLNVVVTEDAATYIDKGSHDDIQHPPSMSDVAATQVIFKREQDPTAQSPLSYREYVYAVASGTREEDAESVLRAQFELVRKALGGAKTGKLVNLAVFDVVFKGKPPVPPLATLTWKDWKGDPIVEFPRRNPKPAAKPTAAPKPAPVAAAAPNVPADVQPPPAAVYQPPPAAAPSFSTAAAAFPAPTSPLAPLSPDPTPGLGPSDRPSQAGRGPVPRGRHKGDELITALFEAMHDLHFLRDAIEGGHFCLSLALETLPSTAGIVHMYDIDKREFIVAVTAGKGAEKLLTRRYPESDPLLAKALRKRRAVVIADASTEEGAASERYAPFGGAKSIIVAPVLYGGRFIGALELINPQDGDPFSEDEGNAFNYIAEQYAEFVSQHGVVIDSEAISMRPGQLRAR